MFQALLATQTHHLLTLQFCRRDHLLKLRCRLEYVEDGQVAGLCRTQS